MAENKKKYEIECVQEGFANGVAPGFPLNDKEKEIPNFFVTRPVANNPMPMDRVFTAKSIPAQI